MIYNELNGITSQKVELFLYQNWPPFSEGKNMLAYTVEWKGTLAGCTKPDSRLNVATCHQLPDPSVPIQ
jgi:hypothetical protein